MVVEGARGRSCGQGPASAVRRGPFRRGNGVELDGFRDSKVPATPAGLSETYATPYLCPLRDVLIPVQCKTQKPCRPRRVPPQPRRRTKVTTYTTSSTNASRATRARPSATLPHCKHLFLLCRCPRRLTALTWRSTDVPDELILGESDNDSDSEVYDTADEDSNGASSPFNSRRECLTQCTCSGRLVPERLPGRGIGQRG